MNAPFKAFKKANLNEMQSNGNYSAHVRKKTHNPSFFSVKYKVANFWNDTDVVSLVSRYRVRREGVVQSHLMMGGFQLAKVLLTAATIHLALMPNMSRSSCGLPLRGTRLTASRCTTMPGSSPTADRTASPRPPSL